MRRQQAVDGADAHRAQISRAAGGGGQGNEALAQLAGGGAGIGAEHHFLRFRPAQEQNVGGP